MKPIIAALLKGENPGCQIRRIGERKSIEEVVEGKVREAVLVWRKFLISFYFLENGIF